MFSNWIHISVILIFLSFLGCTPTNVNVYKAPEVRSESYQVVVIPDFKKTDLEWVPYDSGSEIANMVAEELRKDNEFKVISRSVLDSAELDERVLIVRGTVSGYVRGCKYCEFIFRGIKDKGKMSVQVWVTLIDSTTGDILADLGIDGRAKEPGHGRSKYIRVVDEIVKVIETVNSGQS